MMNLPKWIWIGAGILAFNAGWINAFCLEKYRVAVSHQSGNLAFLGLHHEDVLGILCAFFIGAITSGVIIYNEDLKAGRRYGAALLLESFILFIAAGLIVKDNYFAIYLYAFACGLQNAMVATYSGAVIRTTHLTGVFSDIGSQIGNLISNKPFNKKQVKLHLTIVLSFVSGVFISQKILHEGYNKINAFFPIILTFGAALLYILVIKRKYCIHHNVPPDKYNKYNK